MKLPFAKFRPDVAKTDSGFTSQARNVYPALIGYRPMQAKAAYSAALAAANRGGISAQTADGTWRVFMATATKLYLLASDLTWTDVSLGGGSYTGPGADENWSFISYDGYVYATNANDDLQRISLATPTAFAAVAGAPPRGRYLGVVEDYLVIANLTSDSTMIAWCDTRDPTNWTTGNADTQSFPDGGRVMRIASAAKKVIQEHTERYMIHQPGAAVIFSFEKITNSHGTIAPLSLIEVGESYAYLAEDGFYLNGQPIGKEKVDEYFFSIANTSKLFSVMGGFDPLRRLFRWAFHTGDGTAYDWQLLYNPAIDEWSEVVDDTTFITDIAVPGITLEGLDALYATLEDVAYSLDSRIWEGGRPTFAVIGTDNKLSFYEGTNLEATIETTEANMAEGHRALINGVRPLIEGDTAAATTARVGVRERLADTTSYGSYIALQPSGRAPQRKSGRYLRVGVDIPAATVWTHATGVEIEDRDLVRLGSR